MTEVIKEVLKFRIAEVIRFTTIDIIEPIEEVGIINIRTPAWALEQFL